MMAEIETIDADTLDARGRVADGGRAVAAERDNSPLKMPRYAEGASFGTA